MSGRPYNCRNYITAFHLVGQPPTEDSQPCATDMVGWLTECRRRVTITYWHTNATDSPIFSLSPMLPMFDVQIGLTLSLRVSGRWCRSGSSSRRTGSKRPRTTCSRMSAWMSMILVTWWTTERTVDLCSWTPKRLSSGAEPGTGSWCRWNTRLSELQCVVAPERCRTSWPCGQSRRMNHDGDKTWRVELQ